VDGIVSEYIRTNGSLTELGSYWDVRRKMDIERYRQSISQQLYDETSRIYEALRVFNCKENAIQTNMERNNKANCKERKNPSIEE
jgi:hypothetical protein